MAIDGIYDTGTISVNAGATAVTGVGTAWTTVGITPGDTFEAGGLIGLVESVTDNTHLTLTRAWPGASNLSGVGYQIIENSWLRSDISTAQRQIGRIVNILNGTGYIYPVAAGGTPDNSLGEDGQYALDFDNSIWWKKVGGIWGSPNYIKLQTLVCRVYRSGNQTGMTASAENKIQFNAETVDAASCFDSTTNYRYTPNVAGYYLVVINVQATRAAGDTSEAIIYKNGAVHTYGYYESATVTSPSVINSNVVDLIHMNGSSDYIEGYVYLPSGVTSIAGGTANTFMSIYRASA